MSNMEQLNSETQEFSNEDDQLPDQFDVTELEDGSAGVFPKQDEKLDESEADFYQNLAEVVDEKLLSDLAVEYLQLIDTDKVSREKRDQQYADALRRSGLGDDAPGGAEFDGANKVVHPMIAEAAIDFASTAIKELFPPDGPVKIKIEGKVTPAKLQKAERKKRHMNWQARKQITEFRPSLEQLLTQVPMGGGQYSKLYYWERAKRPKFEFIPIDDIYIPFHAADFSSATRKTHRQRLNRHEFEDRVASGLYLDVDFSSDGVLKSESAAQRATDKIEGKTDPVYDIDGLRTVFEVYCWLDIDDKQKTEGYSYAPYILTIDEPTGKVLGLYRNWDPDEDGCQAIDWIVEWAFIPWRGAYPIGLSHLLGGLSSAATGALRALLDSAHINNAPTAIKLKGAQFNGQSQNISVTQIHEIDAAPGVDDIRKIAMPLPFNPPSTVLFELLGFLVTAGKGLVKTVIEQDPNYSPNTPPGTYLSSIEQGMKVYSAIHARLHMSMEKTLTLLHRLNKYYLDDAAEPDDNEAHAADFTDEIDDTLAFKSDYEGEMDVQPVSDPNIFSDGQRFAQMASVGQLMDKAPDLYDRRAYHKTMLQLMKVPNIDQLLPEPPEMKDENPATENIKMATGVAANVLPDQDHLAHIQTHMDFFMSELYGQNPAIKPVMAAHWLNHMIQHMLMGYGENIRVLIEEVTQMSAKDLMSDDPEVLDALSKAIAAASPKALANAQSLFAQLLPTLAETMQYVQSMTPPTPVDPAAGQLQIAQLNAQLKQAELQHQAQLEELKASSAAAIKEKELQHQTFTVQKENELKLVLESDKLRSAEAVATLQSETELRKNSEDNQTALRITALRIATGQGAGNFKNGNSLDDPGFASGGLVEAASTPDEDPLIAHIRQLTETAKAPPQINVDVSPIAEALSQLPQVLASAMPKQDLSPLVEQLAQRKDPVNIVDTSLIAQALADRQQPSVNVDLSPLLSELQKNNAQVQQTLAQLLERGSSGNQIEEILASTQAGYKELAAALKRRPKVRLETARDPKTNQLIGKFIEEDDADQLS